MSISPTRGRRRVIRSDAFDAETIDLVLDLLTADGRLYFATDFLEYGDVVKEILDSYPRSG